jgi:hypothetical protein
MGTETFVDNIISFDYFLLRTCSIKNQVQNCETCNILVPFGKRCVTEALHAYPNRSKGEIYNRHTKWVGVWGSCWWWWWRGANLHLFMQVNLRELTEYNLALCIDPSTFVLSRDAVSERMQHYYCIFYRIHRRRFATYLCNFKTTSCGSGPRKRRDVQQFSLMRL